MVSHVSEDAPEQSTAARTLKELPLLLIAAGIIAFLIKSLIAQAFFIPSESMLPQLEVDDRVVVSKISYRLHEPRRGDIVVFDSPHQAPQLPDRSNPVVKVYRKIGKGVGLIQPSTEEYIKRVVGLPGDVIDIKDGKVYVNGRELIEPYLAPGTFTFPGSIKLPITIPKGKLWVMGDNRGNSSDSRGFGAIDKKKVVGRTILKVWPLRSMSFL